MDAINEALQRVFNGQCCGWNNVLDIGIVAVFIYYVLVLIRGTRAVQLLLGVLVLVAIYGLAVLLKLELTKFVLSAVLRSRCSRCWSCSSRSCVARLGSVASLVP